MHTAHGCAHDCAHNCAHDTATLGALPHHCATTGLKTTGVICAVVQTQLQPVRWELLANTHKRHGSQVFRAQLPHVPL